MFSDVSHYHATTGISLIEILISLLIFSLLLWGLDAMQVTALREAKVAYYFSLATQQLHNRIERLAVFANTQEETSWPIWDKQNETVLPQGRGRISQGAVAIFWGNPSMQTCHQNKIGLSGCLRMTVPMQEKSSGSLSLR